MTDSEFITQILSHVDNISPTAAENSDRRLKVSEWLNEAVSDVRSRLALPNKRKTVSLDIPVPDSNILVPSDFGEVGHNGGVYLTSTGDPLDWVPEQELQALRQDLGGSTDTPDVYSIFGLDSDSEGSRTLLQFPLLSTGITVVLDYETLEPTFTDDDEDLTLAIPSQYHQRVLIPFVRALAYDSLGDARAELWRAKSEQAFTHMAVQERRGKGTTQQLRSFFGR